MLRTLRLTMPLPLNLANSRMHWAAKDLARRQWQERAVVMERGLRGRHRPMERATVSAVLFVGGNTMDDDNAVSRLKWCLDLLKLRGLIVDDKRPHLTLEGIPEQRNATPRRVELTLTEVA